MKSAVALQIQYDLRDGCAKPKYAMYPDDEFCNDEDDLFDMVVIEDNCIMVKGRKYKPFDLYDKDDVNRLTGAWIYEPDKYNGYNPDRYMITAINDGAVYTSCEDVECESSGEFRNYIWPVELVRDFAFVDTGEPVGKLVEEG